MTIDSLAELGYVSSTLAQIAGRAGVSPGLVAHYFGDKDGLLAVSYTHLDVYKRQARVCATVPATVTGDMAPAKMKGVMMQA